LGQDWNVWPTKK